LLLRASSHSRKRLRWGSYLRFRLKTETTVLFLIIILFFEKISLLLLLGRNRWKWESCRSLRLWLYREHAFFLVVISTVPHFRGSLGWRWQVRLRHGWRWKLRPWSPSNLWQRGSSYIFLSRNEIFLFIFLVKEASDLRCFGAILSLKPASYTLGILSA
jgi:hypothetical protein